MLALDDLASLLRRVEDHLDPEFSWIAAESSRSYADSPKLNPCFGAGKYRIRGLVDHLSPIVGQIVWERDGGGLPDAPWGRSEAARIADEAFAFYLRREAKIAPKTPENVGVECAAFMLSRYCALVDEPRLDPESAADKERIVLAASAGPAAPKKSAFASAL